MRSLIACAFTLLFFTNYASSHNRAPFAEEAPQPHPSEVEGSLKSEEMATVSGLDTQNSSSVFNTDASPTHHVSFKLDTPNNSSEEASAFSSPPPPTQDKKRLTREQLRAHNAHARVQPHSRDEEVEPVHTTVHFSQQDDDHASLDDANSATHPVAFPPFPNFRRESSLSFPTARDEAEPRLNRSMTAWPQVDGATLYDRDEFLREVVEELQVDANSYKEKSKTCRWCNIGWITLGAMTAISSTVVSALGTGEFIDPQAANAASGSLTVGASLFVWAGLQSSKASKSYHKAFVAVLKRLGVPKHLLPPDPHVSFDAFDGGAPGAATETTPRPESHVGGVRSARSVYFAPAATK